MLYFILSSYPPAKGNLKDFYFLIFKHIKNRKLTHVYIFFLSNQ